MKNKYFKNLSKITRAIFLGLAVVFVSAYITQAATTIGTDILTAGTLTLSPLGTPAGTFLAADSSGKVIATTTPTSGTGLGKIARMKTNAVTTSIAASTGVGTYNTVWVMNEVEIDDLGGVADLANSRFVIPTGYTKAIITYNCAWAANSVQPSASDTTLAPIVNMGYRAARIKNSAGTNFGNQRIPAVIGNTTTNVSATTGVITVTPGDWFSVYPAQTSNETLNAGADLASSWMQIELFP